MKNETKRNNKSVSKRSLLLILIGFAFFINPVPFGLDIIPDVIGCVLLFLGLTQLAYFDSSIEDARKGVLYLAVVELLHLFMMRSMISTEISTNRLLAVTGFSIVQGILYIIILKKLFGGISYFAMRNNCNKTLNKCDGTAFLSYLAFFVRIGATFLPELIALLEWKLYVELDPDKHDALAAFVDMKPVIVVLFTLIALGTSVGWFVSILKLFTTLHSESGKTLDIRYTTEYSTCPERVLPKRLKRGSIAIYAALFFAIDMTFDEVRVIPASAMYILLFVSTFLFKDLCRFEKTKKLALPTFIMMLATEFFRMTYTARGAVVIYETDISVVLTAAVIGVAAMIFSMLCIRYLLLETKGLCKNLGLSEASTGFAWFFFCASAVLNSLGFVIPYFYEWTATPRLISSVIFIIQTIRIFDRINEDYRQKISLYGK